MVAKIGRGNHLKGVLIYNFDKVNSQNGNIIHCHNMIEPLKGGFTIPLLERSFEPYLVANNRTEKPILHISLNPHPKDTVSDELFNTLAENYMKEMRYGNQPYVVFKHTDTDRPHIHIVSVCVDENGKRISDSFEKRRSMNVCRDLEENHNLTSAIGISEKQEEVPLLKVDAKAANIKKQIASALIFANENYHFQTLGEYKALLSFFNVTAEEVQGVINGKEKRGLVYFAIDDHGKKVSNPFKSSRFSQPVGLQDLHQKIQKSKAFIRQNKPQKKLRKLVREAMRNSKNQEDFTKALQEHKVSLFIRKNTQGRIYGISFIDHHSKTVFNGSSLGKDMSANVFNSWWNEGKLPTNVADRTPIETSIYDAEISAEDLPVTEKQNFYNSHSFEALGGLLPMNIPEEDDHYTPKKKRKKKRYAKRR